MKNFTLLLSGTMALCLIGCSRNRPSEKTRAIDSVTVMRGQTIFSQDCSSCHTFEVDAIGPALGGIADSAKEEWIKKFIHDPKAVIESGDKRANKLYDRFKSMMPSFSHYSEEKLDTLFAFLQTKKTVVKVAEEIDPNALKDPIPEKIGPSTLVGELELITQIPFSSEENPRTRIVKLDHQPGTDKLFLLDLRGKLYHIKNGKPEVYFDIAQVRKSFVNKPGLATGFGTFAFHPEFARNGLMYTTHTEPPATIKADFGYNDSIRVTLQWVVTEWKANDPKAFPFTGEGHELLRIDVVTGIHGMQEASFNPYAKRGSEDYGLLYIGMGDGGAVENKFPFLVHNREKLWGTIIRIDPAGRNSSNGKYGIPKTNPFVNEGDPSTGGEIFAYGFRNPHRITWLRSGAMLASNIGHTNIESYNLIKKGNDYGWPIREGTFVHLEYGNMKNVYPLPPDDSSIGVTYPVIQYDHDEGKAMSSGYEYAGRDVPALSGKFVFADIVSGRLFYTLVKNIRPGHQAVIKEWQVTLDGKPVTLEGLSGSARVDLRYGLDHRGELYLFTKPDGKLYKVVSAAE